MKKMTLNYGLRFDYFSSAFPDQTLTPATPLVALSVANGGSGITPRNTLQTCATNAALCGYDNLNWKDISPRFGMAYDLRGDGKTAIKASAGKYVAGVTANGTGATANPVARLINSANRTWTDGAQRQSEGQHPAVRSAQHRRQRRMRGLHGGERQLRHAEPERGDRQLAQVGLGQTRLQLGVLGRRAAAGDAARVGGRVLLPPGLRAASRSWTT